MTRFWPLALIGSYLIATVLLFLFGPILWGVKTSVVPFLSLAAAAIVGGYAIGVAGQPYEADQPLPWRALIVAGSILSAVMLFPSAFYFAERMPWHILTALADQGGTYAALQAKLAGNSVGRTAVSFFRAVTYPVIFAVIPLAIMHWRSVTWRLWLAVAIAFSSAAAFSVLRGTDREIFDVIFIASAAALIALAREKKLRELLLTRRFAAIVIAALVIVAIAGEAFMSRRLQRTGKTAEEFSALMAKPGPSGGWMTMMCIRLHCAQQGHPMMASLSDRHRYGLFMATNYLTNGYYGLSLSLGDTQDFKSTFGIGSSPVLTRIYERATGDTDLYKRGYTSRLNDKEWSDHSEWATIFPWLANDVGFPGALFIVALLALLLGKSWRDAAGGNDSAGVVFCILFQAFIYLPANNQLAQSLDGLAALFGWLMWWGWAERGSVENRRAATVPQ